MFCQGGFLIGELLFFGLETCDALLVFGFELLPRGELRGCLRQDGAVERAPHAHVGHLARRGRTVQHPSDPVVILDADGIEFMIVATHAAERHAHEGLSDPVDLGIDVVGLHPRLVGIHDFDVTHHEETGGDDVLGAVFGGFRRHQIPRDLLANELVERFVRVEGIDEVVAVAPGVLGENVVGGPDHVGIAGEIEPVPRPAFPVAFRGEETIHDHLEGLRRGILCKGQNLRLGGRQAREVKAHASQPGVAIRIRDGRDAFLLLLCTDEMIEGIERPLRVLDSGRQGIADRLEGPELAAFDEVDAFFQFGGSGAARVMGTGFDPFFENRDLAGREFCLGRHLELRVDIANRLDEQARLHVAGLNGRTVVSAFDPAGARVEREATLDLGAVRVALKAALLQDGQDFGVEEGGIGCVARDAKG